MKNIFKYICFGLLTTLLVLSTSCADFEEFKSDETLDAHVALGLALGTVRDSSVVVTVVNPSDGYVTLGIKKKPVGAVVIDSAKFFEQNVAGFTYVTKEVTKDQATSITFSDLEQNTDYVIVGMSSNIDGVLGEQVELAVKTGDSHEPNLIGTTPEFGDLATTFPTNDGVIIFPTNGEIVLEFDEPVVYDDAKNVNFYYYNDDVTVQGADLSITVEGSSVTISSDVLARNREIIFISWEEGAFTDVKGNPVAAMESGIDEEGYPFGIFTRVVAKLFVPESITPTSEDSVSAAGFTEIILEYSEKVGGFHSDYLDGTTDPIRVTYTDANGEATIKNVPNANVSFSLNSATITLPLAPVAGQTVSLDMQTNTFKVGITNPTEAVSAFWNIKP